MNAAKTSRKKEARTRSLCNRSSLRVIDVSTIESGQNVTNDFDKVTCSFCRKMIERRPNLLERNRDHER